MTTAINGALMKLSRRAERSEPEALVETFVDVGSLFSLLSSIDHQVLYGRRGTGKTHALQYLGQSVRRAGDIAVYVDMRTVGSSGGVYGDPSLSVTERGTRLLSDTLSFVFNELMTEVLQASYQGDLSEAMRSLDLLGEALTDVSVVGEEEREVKTGGSAQQKDSADIGFKLGKSPEISLGAKGEAATNAHLEVRTLTRGPIRQRVHFGAVSSALRSVSNALPGRIWLLLDEWSDVPLDLQPLLADLIRRCVMPVQRLTVKIGAIEQRSNFVQNDGAGGYVGLELGADIAADVDLDDFMVFGNDAEKAKSFFRELLFKHVSAMLPPHLAPTSSADLVRQAFTQVTAFDEFVRAAEGVPRDAINIGAVAAQQADDGPISVPIVRSSARRWYLRDKEKAVEANADAMALLHWVIDEVIQGRRARAFLLRQGDPSGHVLIGSLYDSRVIHVIKRGVSAHDQPGARFNVYALDYGCYVELISTAYAPQGLLPGDVGFVEVPPDDYRSIRRAILELKAFEERPPSA